MPRQNDIIGNQNTCSDNISVNGKQLEKILGDIVKAKKMLSESEIYVRSILYPVAINKTNSNLVVLDHNNKNNDVHFKCKPYDIIFSSTKILAKHWIANAHTKPARRNPVSKLSYCICRYALSGTCRAINKEIIIRYVKNIRSSCKSCYKVTIEAVIDFMCSKIKVFLYNSKKKWPLWKEKYAGSFTIPKMANSNSNTVYKIKSDTKTITKQSMIDNDSQITNTNLPISAKKEQTNKKKSKTVVKRKKKRKNIPLNANQQNTKTTEPCIISPLHNVVKSLPSNEGKYKQVVCKEEKRKRVPKKLLFHNEEKN